MTKLFEYSINDVPLNVAIDAHRGTSFVPEKRGEQEREMYLSYMQDLEARFAKFVTSDNKADIVADLQYHQQKYLRLLLVKLYSQSRCISSMITGPSNFPTRRNEKANASYDKRIGELLEWAEKHCDRMLRKYDPRILARAPISSDDPAALEKLQEKLERLEDYQENMKAVNKIARAKGKTEEQKRQMLAELGLQQKTIDSVFSNPLRSGVLGFDGYELTNNGANIRRIQDRIKDLERKFSEKTTEETHGSVVIIDNVEDNRLQIEFPGKPSDTIRSRLKSRGFKWAPSVGRWQRYRSNDALQVAREIVNEYNNGDKNDTI